MKNMKQYSFSSINPFLSKTNSASREIFMINTYFDTILHIVTYFKIKFMIIYLLFRIILPFFFFLKKNLEVYVVYLPC